MMKIKLMEDSFTEEEIIAVNNCLKSGNYTQGELVEEFEKKFAEWNSSKYGVMVNSGSSANLLMISILKEKFGLKDGDEILVPSVTWPTTVYPIIQNNLVPVFCDVDESFNISLDSIKKMKTNKTKAIFVVHLLGQPAKIQEIKKFCEDNNLILIEDCCESLGAKCNEIKVGNFGIMSSFSFYFGHHITTIEGGMILTNELEIWDILRSMRSHGWVRKSLRLGKYYLFENNDFLFDMLGYNLRSTDVNAAIGLVQLKKLDNIIKKRVDNHRYFLNKISALGIECQKVNLEETSSFSLAVLFRDKSERDYILRELNNQNIECRPIVAGNLLRQPVFSKGAMKADFTIPMADKIHYLGLYLPNNQFIDQEKVDYMIEKISELMRGKNGY